MHRSGGIGARQGLRFVAVASTLILLCLTSAAAQASSHGLRVASPHARLAVPGSVLVRLPRSATQRAVVLSAAGVSGATPTGVAGWSVVQVSGQGGIAQLTSLLGTPNVQPNYAVHAFTTPNDPDLGAQDLVVLTELPKAWSVSKGAGQRIAIVDSGVAAVPDVAPHLLMQKNFVGGSKPGDLAGHGTAVAGIAAAATNNGRGIAGVAWDARILSARVLDATGRGTEASVASGIVWSVRHGATVINLSLGGTGNAAVLRTAVRYALAHNVVVVAAVGNTSTARPEYPAAYPGVIGVSATEPAEGRFAYFSSYGPDVDLAAPGANVFTTLADGTYGPISGTSASAPVVSGVAALVRARHPAWSPAQVARVMENHAVGMGFPGYDWYYGHGVVDAAGALGLPTRHVDGPFSVNPPEPNGMPARATPLAGSAQGWISPNGDVDWYGVSVAQPGWITITVTPPYADVTDTEQMAPVVSVYSPDLRLIRAETPTYWGQIVTLEVPAKHAGSYDVRVSNYGGSDGPGAYTITESQASSPSSIFAPGRRHAIGLRSAAAVAIADVTGDGRRDVLATTNYGQYSQRAQNYRLFVFPQLATGGLGVPQVYPVGAGMVCNTMGIGTGDLNGDGHTDVVVATANGLDVFLQHAGRLSGPALIGAGTNFCYPDVVDWNGDGRPDILASDSTGMLHLFLNTGSGYQGSGLIQLGHDTFAIGDLNGDGRPDIASVCCGSTALDWKMVAFMHQPGGSLVTQTYSTGTTYAPAGIAIGDVTGDGHPDVVAAIYANAPNNALQVFAGKPGGGFAGPTVYGAGDDTQQVLLTDVNGDGRKDVVIAAEGGPIGVYLQQSSGRLAPEALSDLGIDNQYIQYQTLAAGDLNGDGRPDLVTTEMERDIVVGLQNTLDWPRPGDRPWLANTAPAPLTVGAPRSGSFRITAARALLRSSVTTATVHLVDRAILRNVPVRVSYNTTTHVITVQPLARLAFKRSYAIMLNGLRDAAGHVLGRTQATQFQTG